MLSPLRDDALTKALEPACELSGRYVDCEASSEKTLPPSRDGALSKVPDPPRELPARYVDCEALSEKTLPPSRNGALTKALDPPCELSARYEPRSEIDGIECSSSRRDRELFDSLFETLDPAREPSGRYETLEPCSEGGGMVKSSLRRDSTLGALEDLDTLLPLRTLSARSSS